MDEKVVREIIDKALSEGRKALYEYEAKKIANAIGIPIPNNIFIPYKDMNELNIDNIKLKQPLVVKIVSPDIIHKSDVGGVKLNVFKDNLIDTLKEMVETVRKYKPDTDIKGFLIEEMAEKGVETIVGLVKDPQFGPVVMFGLGGVFVEIYKDVSFRLAPLDKNDALDMIREVKAYKILQGYRGLPPSDIDAIADVIVKIGELGWRFREISELDINPLACYPSGVLALDVRIILGD